MPSLSGKEPKKRGEMVKKLHLSPHKASSPIGDCRVRSPGHSGIQVHDLHIQTQRCILQPLKQIHFILSSQPQNQFHKPKLQLSISISGMPITIPHFATSKNIHPPPARHHYHLGWNLTGCANTSSSLIGYNIQYQIPTGWDHTFNQLGKKKSAAKCKQRRDFWPTTISSSAWKFWTTEYAAWLSFHCFVMTITSKSLPQLNTSDCTQTVQPKCDNYSYVQASQPASRTSIHYGCLIMTNGSRLFFFFLQINIRCK